MASVNHVVLTGNLTSDPEVKYLPSGMAVCKLRMAVNNNYKDKSGQWQEDTCFIDVDVWGSQAERIAESCKKGSKVLVEGSLREDTWEDREGNKRSKIKVRAQRADHIGEPRGAGAPGEGRRASAPPSETAPRGQQPAAGGEFPPDDVDDDLPF
jgi:single-strand DNA-binding protein